MTGKERVETVLRGGVPDRVPYAPNIGQWFSHRKHTSTLPDELEGCENEVDAMIRLQCDLFCRRLGPLFKEETPGIKARRYYEPIEHGSGLSQRREIEPPATLPFNHEEIHPANVWVITEVITPKGTLTNKARFMPRTHTTFEHEHFVKDFRRDYPALREIVERTTSRFDPEAYQEAEDRVGDHGIAFAPMAQAPIKLLHNWAGQENATLFMIDWEQECRELFEIHNRKVLDMAVQGADSAVSCFILGDNLDSMFYTPTLVRKFDLHFRRQVAEVLHASDKLLFSHACGRLWRLREFIAESGMDGLEAISHPPLGDLPLPEAKKIHPHFIVNGGMTAHEQEILGDARTRIHEFVRELFNQMRPFDRFIFSTACNTSISTPWENLVAFRDACWEFGETSG